MDKIKFLTSEDIYDVSLQLLATRVQVGFKTNLDRQSAPINDGFYLLNEHNHTIMGDFSTYIYIYRELDNKTVILTNRADDKYVEPEPAPPTPEPEPYVPTLEEVQAQKVEEMDKTCQSTIFAGVQVGDEHYSYTLEDQINIKELFDLGVQTRTPVYYHPDNGACREYTLEEFIIVYLLAAGNKMSNVTYFNQLKSTILAMTEIDDVKAVVYGQELTGEYLEHYNTAMAQFSETMKTLLGDLYPSDEALAQASGADPIIENIEVTHDENGGKVEA